MGKYTKADVMALAAYTRREREQSRPVAFLTGAGCSLKADIPLATGLVARFKAEIRPDLPDDYGQCMAQLTKEERKDVLNPILLASKVNWANIALAGLLKAGWIGRILTFNFDNVLVRACGLDGYYPPVYDFGVSPAKTFDHIVPGSILHLHGQGSGLAMMNSTEETRDHANKLGPLLDYTMRHSGLVVIGYSGKNDAAFDVLSGTANNDNHLYWCSFGEEPDTHVKTLVAKSNIHHHLSGVDADVFLIELARELECFPPVLFTRHEQHLLDELTPVVEFPAAAGGGTQILVELRRKLDDPIAATPKETDFDRLLYEGKWDDLVDLRDQAEETDEVEAVVWGYIMQGVALVAQAEVSNAPALFDEAGKKYAAALAIKPDMHEALNNWGIALATQAKATNNPALFEAAGNKYAAALAIEPNHHNALHYWGVALADLAKATNNPALFESAKKKYEAALAINPNDHDVLHNWGLTLADQARTTGNPAIFVEAGEKFAAALAIEPDDHSVLLSWGLTLADQARTTGNPALFVEAEKKYAAALAIKPDDLQVLNCWGVTLGDRAVATNNPALFDEAIQKYAAALAVKPDDHYVPYNIACVLALSGRNSDARIQLEKCLASGILPPAEEIEGDGDFASLRDLDWFRTLLKDRRAQDNT